MSIQEKERDWSFVLKRHRLGILKKNKKTDPEVEVNKKFRLAARAAALPKRFWKDVGWTNLDPEPLIILEPVKGGRSVNISAKSQKRWIKRMLLDKDYMKRGCIIIFGDYLAEAAERIAFGIISSVLKEGVPARVFHPLDLVKGPPKDLEGKELQYQVVCLNRIHTDDEGPRRGLVRDFVNRYYERAFKIVVIYGDDPLNFFYKRIGLSPQAMFMYPYEGQLIRSNDELKEH